MTAAEINTWQAVEEEVRRRINQRIWKPGDFIPHEADLAQEFGCARATVNRALRGLAEAGLLDRRRKAGTQVAINPVRKARLDIPVIRDEIENKGLAYRHSILERKLCEPPANVQARMQTGSKTKLLHLKTLHTADGNPYAFENRWINPKAVPAIMDQDFSDISPNEWLVREVPFEGGDLTFLAVTATAHEVSFLSCEPNQGLFAIDRTTWNPDHIITQVRLTFHPGYRIHTEI